MRASFPPWLSVAPVNDASASPPFAPRCQNEKNLSAFVHLLDGIQYYISKSHATDALRTSCIRFFTGMCTGWVW